MKKLFLAGLMILSFNIWVNATTFTVTQTTLAGDQWFPCPVEGDWTPTVTSGGFIDALYQSTLDNSGPHIIEFDVSSPTTIVIPNNARTQLSCAEFSNLTIRGPVDINGDPLVTLRKSSGAVLQISGDASNVTIENLIIDQNTNSNAILLETNNNVIRNCVFTNSNTIAIQVSGASGSTIENCTISTSNDDAIYLTNGSTNTTISGVTISNAGNNGIQSNGGSGLVISDFNVTFSVTANIFIDGTDNVEIRNGQTTFGPSAGINVDGSAGITISNVTASQNSTHGIEVTNSSNVIIENSTVIENGTSENITTTKWNGISLYGYEGFVAGETMATTGIRLENVSSYEIDSNYVSGNNGHGIYLVSCNTGSKANGLITRNIVGLNAAGDAAFRNFGEGILLQECSNATIGGIGLGNVVSGNGNFEAFTGGAVGDKANGAQTSNMHGHGIEVRNSASVDVIGNFAGTDITGTTGIGNHLNGIYLNGCNDVTVGGASAELRNIVCGNGFAFQDIFTSDSDDQEPDWIYGVRHGIQLHDATNSVYNNTVTGNYIGLGVDGSTIIENRQDGISFLGFDWDNGYENYNNTIGGTNPGEGNIIVGGTWGMFIQGPRVRNNEFYGNIIGATDATGAVTVPATTGGVQIQSGARNNTFGSTTAGNYIFSQTGTTIGVDGNAENYPDISNPNNINPDNRIDYRSIGNDILGNIEVCNASDGILLRNNGNEDMQVWFNMAESRSGFISGLSLNDGDRIDIYIQDTCGSSPTCQASSGNNSVPHAGYLWVASVSAVENTLYPDEIGQVGEPDKNGYWEYDLSEVAATTAGLTFTNAVVTATNANGSTSEFHICGNFSNCTAPNSVSVNVTDPQICDGESTTLTAEYTGGEASETYVYYWYQTSQGGTLLDGPNVANTYDATAGGTVVVYVVQEGLTDTLDCGLSHAATISLTPTPSDLLISGDDIYCEGETGVSFTATPTGSTPDAIQWAGLPTGASFSGGQGTGTVTVNFGTATPGDYTLTATGINNGECEGTAATHDFTIQALPEPNAPIGASEICSDSSGIVYTADPNNPGSSYDWTITTGGTIQNDGDPNDGEVIIDIGSGVSTVRLYYFETDDAGCTSADSGLVRIAINTRPISPTINGPDSLCSDITDNYTVSGSASYAWTVTGGTPLSGTGNDLDITAGAPGTLTIDVLATSSAGCPALDSSEKEVTILELPSSAVISGEDTICVGASPSHDYTIVSPNAGSDYTWTVSNGADITLGQGSSTIEVDFDGASTGIGAVEVIETDQFGCRSAAAADFDFEVFGDPDPIIITGDQTPECQSNGVPYSVTGNPGSTYLWTVPTNSSVATGQGTSAITVDFLNLNGNVSVVETSAAGCAGEDAQLPITLQNCALAANFNVVSERNCEGDVFTFTEISSGTNIEEWRWDFGDDASPVGDTSFTSGNSHQVTFALAGEKEIKLVVRNNLNEEDSLIQTITVNPLPRSVDIDGPQEICDEAENVQYVITNPESGALYSWEVLNDGDVVTRSADRDSVWVDFGSTDASAYVKVTIDLNNCPGADSIQVVMNDNPETGIISGDTTVCEGEEGITFSVQENPGSSYSWTLPDGATIEGSDTTASISVNFDTTGGSVTVLETNNLGCTDITGVSEFEVSVEPIPDAPTIVGPLNVCVGDENVVYEAEGGSSSNFEWLNFPPVVDTSVNGNIANLDFEPSEGTGAIVVREISEFECESPVASELINIRGLPETRDIIGSEFGCEGQTFIYSVEANDGETFDWNASPNSASVTEDGSDTARVTFGDDDVTVSVVIESEFGCIQNGITPLVVSITPLVDNLGLSRPFGNFCDDNSGITYDFQITADNADEYNAVWTPADAVVSTTTSEGTYEVTFDPEYAGQTIRIEYSAGNLCNTAGPRSFTFDLDTSKIQNLSLTSTPICEEETAMFVVSTTENDPFEFYTWFYNGDTIQFENDDTLTVTTINGVYLEDGDTISVVMSPSICIWVDSSDLDVENYADVRDLPVALAFAEYKEDYDLEELIIEGDLVLDYPEVNLFGDDELEDPGSSEGDEITYVWNYWNDEETRDSLLTDVVKDEDEINASIQTERNITTVYLTVDNGVCSVTDSVVINVDLDYWIPSAFSPNDDGSYDDWVIENIDRWPGAHITVYNRWGNLVYDNIEDAGGSVEPWDGTRDGQDLPMGTYFYIVKFTDSLVEEGDVSILR